MTPKTDRRDFTLGFRVSRLLLNDLLKESLRTHYAESAERLAASAAGRDFSRYPQDSPSHRRRERFRRFLQRFKDAYRCLVHGDLFEDYYE